MVKDEIEMTEICVTSSTAKIHTAGLKIGIRSMSALSKSSMKKGIMTTTVPITTNLTYSAALKGGIMQGELRHFPMT
jgi:hypothetical protein